MASASGSRHFREDLAILHATDRHTRANSGITFAVNGLIKQLTEGAPQCRITLLSVDEADVPLPAGTRQYHSRPSLRLSSAWRYSPDYTELCAQIIAEQEIQLAHIHGAWTHATYAANLAALRCGIPSVLTNHGQFTPWALSQPNRLGVIRKQIYLSLMRRRLFERISVLHAITPLERDSLYGLFPRSRIEIIPNAIDLVSVDAAIPTGQTPASDDRYILFIGRLHPVKGLAPLIEAFGAADIPSDCRLVIVGPEENKDYASFLRRKIEINPRCKRIELRNPTWNPTEKYALMRDAWMTMVPSYTEVISLVNLESSACCTPTITTHATGLADWEDGGGILIEPTVASIAAAMARAMRWSDGERNERGQASRRLVEMRYSAAATTPSWVELYRSLV